MKYQIISQKPYCCVPANLQIILKSHHIKYDSQEKIGKELGLVKPSDGTKPSSGWGTQVGKTRYSLNNYFKKHQIPLQETYYYTTNLKQIKKQLQTWLNKQNNIIGCADWGTLYDNNITNGHVFLIESLKDNQVTILDTELKKRLNIPINKLSRAIKRHSQKRRAGFWVIKSCKSKTYQLGIYINLPNNLENQVSNIKQYLTIHHVNIYRQEPHISIYTAAFKKEKASTLIRNISQIHLKSFRVNIGNLKKEKHRDSIFYSLDVSPKSNFMSLHNNIFSVTDKLRDGLIRKKDLKRMSDGYYSQKELRAIKKYGYPRVKENYTPHITLGLINSSSKNTERFITKNCSKLKHKSFIVKNITIGLFEEEALQKPVLIKKINLIK